MSAQRFHVLHVLVKTKKAGNLDDPKQYKERQKEKYRVHFFYDFVVVVFVCIDVIFKVPFKQVITLLKAYELPDK